jgi:phosphoribosyl 1,2-cyclic phosphodiesterase
MSQCDISFWGVRGTVPVISPNFRHYGGNTSCISVRCGERQIILDAGTGIFPLGEQLKNTQEIDILLSHLHIDHIQGFPFFGPLYKSGRTVRVWAGNLLPDYRLEDVIRNLMHLPLFPITLEQLQADLHFHDFHAGEALQHPAFENHGIKITTLLLNHPGRSTGYRIEYKCKSICYITDVEHQKGILDPAILSFIKGADLFIYDCTFDDQNFSRFQGWGHSTWQQAVRLAKEAGVKQLVDFHHDPHMDDAALHARAEALKSIFPNGIIAKEGDTLQLF